LNVHFHALVLDGVYVVGADGSRTFHALAAPEPHELARVVTSIRRRTERLLVREGLLDAPDDGVDDDDALVLWAASASHRAAHGIQAGRKRRRPSRAYCAEEGWFSLHAGVVIPSWNRDALERLCRYVARPALSHDRLRQRDDGLLELRLKTPWANGTTHIVMTDLELLAKLAVLVPPPKFHVVTYHGVLAPAHPGRAAIVPTPQRVGHEGCRHATGAPHATYIRWADLLKRIFNFDALKCGACGGRLRVRAVVRGVWVAPKLLGVLGRPVEVPSIHRSRDGPEDASQEQFTWS
jgi:hypothetical protein